MPNQLSLLYKAATGSLPTTGQALKAAIGAASGDSVKDWEVSDWSFGGDVPVPAGEGGPNYSDGHLFDMTISFTQNEWAGGGSGRTNIKRTGNVVLLEELTGGPGVHESTVSSNIVAAATGSTVDVTAKAPFRTNQVASAYVWFTDFTEPDQPGDSGEHEVWFRAQLSAGSAAAVACSFKLAHVVDNGPYNPDLERVFNYNMLSRQASPSDWEWEWHLNSSYTNLYATGANLFETGSVPSTVWDFWLRGRPNGAASWTNVGNVHWEDPR